MTYQFVRLQYYRFISKDNASMRDARSFVERPFLEASDHYELRYIHAKNPQSQSASGMSVFSKNVYANHGRSLWNDRGVTGMRKCTSQSCKSRIMCVFTHVECICSAWTRCARIVCDGDVSITISDTPGIRETLSERIGDASCGRSLCAATFTHLHAVVFAIFFHAS